MGTSRNLQFVHLNQLEVPKNWHPHAQMMQSWLSKGFATWVEYWGKQWANQWELPGVAELGRH